MKSRGRSRHIAGTAFAWTLLSCCLAIALAIPTPAAELPVKALVYKAPIAVPPYNWSGFYLGANFGGAWSNSLPTIAGVPWDPGSSRFLGGIEAGYNLQAGPLLIGIEGDFDWTSFGRPTVPVTTPFGVVQASASQPWISTLAARFGLVSTVG